MGLFSKGKKKWACHTNAETGELSCESFRENSDGTKEMLASIKAEQDAGCNPVIVDSIENEEGELKELENKLIGKMRRGCPKNQKPEGY